MHRLQRGLREFWVVVRSLWANAAVFAAMLLVSAVLLQACHCYPGMHFHERLKAALYLARLEGVPNDEGQVLPTVLAFVLPLLTIVILGEGALRVAAIYLGRHRHREEWDRLMASTLHGHVVICGAGDMGRTLLEAMLQRDPHAEAVVVDIHPGVLQELTGHGPHLLHVLGDITSLPTLEAAHVEAAATVVITSGDDAHNLEAAAKALRLNPKAEVWVRLKHSGIREMTESLAPKNLHFFSPYHRAAEDLAAALYRTSAPASKAGG